MALTSTIYKARLNVADMDRHIYGDFNLTLARHPSETEQRLMLRLLAFALHADQQLAFGRGISTGDEPDLWLKDLAGDIELWIDLGNPDPDRLRKACGRADRVYLYAYGDRATPVWWDKYGGALSRLEKLQVYQVSDSEMDALGAMAGPGMSLQCSVSDGEILLSDAETSLSVAPQRLQG